MRTTRPDDASAGRTTQMFAENDRNGGPATPLLGWVRRLWCRLRGWWPPWRTSTSPFCWSTRETWSWRCYRKMRNCGSERRRGYGESQFIPPMPPSRSLSLHPSMLPCLLQEAEERAAGDQTERFPSAQGVGGAPVRPLHQDVGPDLWPRRTLRGVSAARVQRMPRHDSSEAPVEVQRLRQDLVRMQFGRGITSRGWDRRVMTPHLSPCEGVSCCEQSLKGDYT